MELHPGLVETAWHLAAIVAIVAPLFLAWPT
jgi:hypothetical protein